MVSLAGDWVRCFFCVLSGCWKLVYTIHVGGGTCLILPCQYKLILNTYLSGGEILR